jgi:hypothetical protein
MKHTNGPWAVSKPREFLGLATLEVSNDLTPVWIAQVLFEQKHGEANGRLIAAAPDMLAALKLASVNWDTKSQKQAAKAWKAIQAAIAKAEGEYWQLNQ